MPRKTYDTPVARHTPVDGLTTRNDLIFRIYEDMPWLQPDEIRDALDTIFGTIEDALVEGDHVYLQRFGTLELNWQPPRDYWVERRRRSERKDGKVVIRFFQGDVWWDREGFEPLTQFENRLRNKKRRDYTAWVKKGKPRE